MDRVLYEMFRWSCGLGCNADRAATEWYIGKEIYDICPECGEDPRDCECDLEGHIKAEICFCMN